MMAFLIECLRMAVALAGLAFGMAVFLVLFFFCLELMRAIRSRFDI